MNGYEMFDAMTANIKQDTVRMLLHVKVEQKVEREEVAKVTGTNKDETLQKGLRRARRQRSIQMIPCPCGSGKITSSAVAKSLKVV